MTQSQDEGFGGDLPVSPISFAGEARPLVSHEVIATYAADAARSVPGVADLHVSSWKGLSSRVRETHAGGVVVRDAHGDSVDVDIHLKVGWGVSIPDLAPQVEEAARARVAAMLDLDLGAVTLFIDEIEGPTEACVTKEG